MTPAPAGLIIVTTLGASKRVLFHRCTVDLGFIKRFLIGNSAAESALFSDAHQGYCFLSLIRVTKSKKERENEMSFGSVYVMR